MKRPVAPFGDGRIVLRLVEDRDLETILDWRNRDEARVWFKTSAKLSLEGHRNWYAQYLSKDDDFFFLIESDGQPVGQCGIYDVDYAAGTAEIGRFLVAPDKAGHGFITRACTELVRFATATLALRYLCLEVMERNARAIGVYARCGFTEESRAKGLIRMSLRPAVLK